MKLKYMNSEESYTGCHSCRLKTWLAGLGELRELRQALTDVPLGQTAHQGSFALSLVLKLVEPRSWVVFHVLCIPLCWPLAGGVAAVWPRPVGEEEVEKPRQSRHVCSVSAGAGVSQGVQKCARTLPGTTHRENLLWTEFDRHHENV